MKRLSGILLLFVTLLLVVRIVPAAEVLTNDTTVTIASREGQEEQNAIALYREGKTLEAVAEFDRLIAKNPSEDGLKVWKALAQLEQARGMRESKVPQYKPVVLGAWAVLRTLNKSQQANPGWHLAVGKALWLNDRRDRGKGFVETALTLRPDYAEALLLLADMVYDEWISSPNPDTTTKWRMAVAMRKRYETALSLPDLSSVFRAEAFYKMGVISAELENKTDDARGYWERAAKADPVSRYGRTAQEKLKAMPAK